MRPELDTLVVVAAVAALVAGCGEPEGLREASAVARVKPKSGEVWGRDLGNALDLHGYELCKELGTVDCLGEAHLVTLGGVEPTRLGVDEPLQNASVSAPIAADRVALAACAERWSRDTDGPAVIFGPVLGANEPSVEARSQVSTTLVRRLLGRDATKTEVEGLVQLYDEIAPLSSNPVSDWSVGACVVVATSLEALFY